MMIMMMTKIMMLLLTVMADLRDSLEDVACLLRVQTVPEPLPELVCG
jgi:hypothetical protein